MFSLTDQQYFAYPISPLVVVNISVTLYGNINRRCDILFYSHHISEHTKALLLSGASPFAVYFQCNLFGGMVAINVLP